MARLCLLMLTLAVTTYLSAASPVHAQQWLTNGDFESGTSGWFRPAGQAVACEPQAGSGAYGTGLSGAGDGKLATEVWGPMTPGTYTLSGWTRVQSGAGIVRVTLAFASGGGSVTGITVPKDIPSGAQFTPFSVSHTVGLTPESASVALHIDTETGAELCIDSLQLTTPDPTPGPSATPTETPVPTATPAPSATVAVSPTKTAASPTPVPAGPSFVFTNGGFEAGLAGWQKYGGTLSTTGAARSGSQAGLLASTTDSTKWAYQAVAVQAGAYYEFAGYVSTDGGVSEALLRISWYASSDTSGSALSTTDSLTRLGGGSGSYSMLTTGPVQAPSGARTARVRVLLTPLGAGPASIRIDDMSFANVAAPTSTPSPSPTATPTVVPSATPSATPPVPLLGALPTLEPTTAVNAGPPDAASPLAIWTTVEEGGASQAGSGSPITALFAQVAGTRFGSAGEGTRVEDPPSTFVLPAAEEGGSIPWPWLLGAGLLTVGLGGAYLQSRQSHRGP